MVATLARPVLTVAVRVGEPAHCPACRRCLFVPEGAGGATIPLRCYRCPAWVRVVVIP